MHYSDSPPANSKTWGLGKLISHYRAEGSIPDNLLERLDNLNEYRKILYHFGHSESDNALLQRTHDLVERVGPGNVRREYKKLHGHDGGNKAILSFALDRVRQETALEALTTGLMFRSWVAEQSGLEGDEAIFHVLAVYRAAGWDASTAPDVTLRDTASKTGWIDTSVSNSIKVMWAGDEHIVNKMPTQARVCHIFCVNGHG